VSDERTATPRAHARSGVVREMHHLSIMRILTYLLTLSILGSLGGCVVRERGYHHRHPTTVIIRH
jgi:hypothetical protein